MRQAICNKQCHQIEKSLSSSVNLHEVIVEGVVVQNFRLLLIVCDLSVHEFSGHRQASLAVYRDMKKEL